MKSASESDVAEIEQLQSSISPDSGCNIQFTSGTTGHPKAALVNHMSLVNAGKDSSLRLEHDKNNSVICSNMPLFHIAGVVSIINTMAYGSTMVHPAPHFHPEYSLKAIVGEKCNVIYGTPNSKLILIKFKKFPHSHHSLFVPVYIDMIGKQKELNLDLPDIRLSLVGAAICTPKLVKDARKYLGVKNFLSMFGMTETSATGFQSVPGEDEDLVYNHVGLVADNLEVKVIDPKGNAVPFGSPGELCIRGYCTMLGYLNDEAKTKEVLGPDQWYEMLTNI
jgi:medium-chain acyl-CoA ligase, mitochondrial